MTDEPKNITLRDIWLEVVELRKDFNGRVDSLEQWRAFVNGVTKATLKIGAIVGGVVAIAGIIWQIVS